MSAPRIDGIRRDVKDAIDSLRYLSDNLEDVHALAYNRHKAAQEAKVRGGSRDYALDSHGDRKARDLYEDTAKAAGKVFDEAMNLATELRAYLTDGKGGSRKDTSADCTADEVIAALAARRRRRLLGEYEPHTIATQPIVRPTMDWRAECEALRSAVRKVTAEFAGDHQSCQPPDEGLGRYKRKLLRRYPTKNLSQREREAWRAAQSVADPTAVAAS